MMDGPLTLTDILLLGQAIVVVGGGFYFAGRLGAKIDHLATAIEGLRAALATQGIDLRTLEARVTRLEARLDLVREDEHHGRG